MVYMLHLVYYAATAKITCVMYSYSTHSVVAKCRLPTKLLRLKKQRLPAGFLAGDESVKHNGHFNPSLSRLNLIFS